MFCLQCGIELPDTAQFCYSCGAKTAISEQKIGQVDLLTAGSGIRTQRIPAYDFIVCAKCGNENSAPDTACTSCGAELPWKKEQKKYNKGLVNVLAYTRPFGKRRVLYQIWMLCEHPAGNDELRTNCAMYQGRPFHKPYLTEQLDVIEQPNKDVERTFFAFRDFVPGYLLGVFPSVKQAYWFEATPKGIVGGLEEECDFLSPILLVNLDNVEASYNRMAPITVKKIKPLIARINELRNSYPMIPYRFSFQYIYEVDYWVDENWETHSVGMPYYDYYFEEDAVPRRSEPGRLRDPYHDIAFHAWLDAMSKARSLGH